METQCIETEQDKLVVDESAVELGDMTSNDYHQFFMTAVVETTLTLVMIYDQLLMCISRSLSLIHALSIFFR